MRIAFIGCYADFEYGLQPTNGRAIGMMRGYPAFTNYLYRNTSVGYGNRCFRRNKRHWYPRLQLQLLVPFVLNLYILLHPSKALEDAVWSG